MTDPDSSPVTRLLKQVREGQEGAAEFLLPLVYQELQGLARKKFSDERGDHTLQPTALVHEAWLKLAGHLDRIEDRKHFYAVASRAMRQVLSDHARGRSSQKRGDRRKRVTLDANLAGSQPQGIEFFELDDLLGQLEALNPRHARVVELRILGGLTISEVAEVIEVSHSTIEADWVTARAWLRTRLKRA
ncbi:MAG: RNA polymerase sigma-70 factor (ECF subfamily) [Planctomycetota bacterium]|jgi:RNA polymerase sigma-70 factor (ECF subfamily)